MPNKDELTVLTGLPKDLNNDLVVQKSRPLFALWQSSLTLSNFKILDAYLARIDSHKPENRKVRFSKGELEKILGVTKINKDDLEARLRGLYTPIDLDPNNDDDLDLVCLFERAKATKDKYGMWQVDLNCTESAMQYVFNVEKIGYFRYKLRSITNLTSRYSYILFMYLEVNRNYKKEWVIEIDELRRLLHCADDPCYNKFGVFNDRILKKCHKDLHEKTECRFSYTTVKRGKYVVGVKFTLEDLPKALEEPVEDPNQITVDQHLASLEEHDINDPLDILMSACPEFSRAEMQQIREILSLISEDKLPASVPHLGVIGTNIEFRWNAYLSERYAAMLRMDAKNPIRNHFNYFVSMLRNDAGLPKN